jgi:hypothetical protein
MNYTATCLQKFRTLPQAIKDKVGSLKALQKIKILEEKYGVSFSFLVVLVAIGELSLDGIMEYLMKKHNLSEEDAFEARDDLTNEIFSELLIVRNPFVDSIETVEEFFRERLLYLFQNEEDAKNVNEAVLVFLSEDEKFQENIRHLLLENNEKLGVKRITINGTETDQTISNWLRDFIAQHGSEELDELALAKYLTQSPNIKLLNAEEKELVRKLFKTYYNITFFPDSLLDIPVEDWEIIPTLINEEKKKIKPGIKEAEEPTEKEKQVYYLEQSLVNYDPETLEYKVIVQEINRLRRELAVEK